MDTILPNLSRDGTIQTQKQKKLGKNLSLYLNLYVERAERYELHIRAPDGETQVIEEDAITGKQYRDKMSVVSPGGSSHLVEFSLWSKHKTARLRMKTFYTVSLKKKGIQYKKYFKNLFRLIEEDEIENLVIDIRGNAGGSLYLAADLLAYLLDGRFRFLERYQLSPNLHLTHKQHIARDPFVSFKWLVTLKREEWRSFPWNRLLKPQKPKRRFRFKGKIYVLIDGETFSAASMFAALLRGRVNTIFVGEETGGSTCGNGVSPIHLTLPNSRLRVQIPFGYIRLAVPEDTECSRGVIPDFVVDWTPEDLISNRDPVLDFALGMITQ
jgi:C-terminal processing protease CtpA/Prc